MYVKMTTDNDYSTTKEPQLWRSTVCTGPSVYQV